jgi:CheY-like chemotaxis protein
MKHLDCILLVEDDDTINFFNQYLIRHLGICESVVVATNGVEALDYLKLVEAGKALRPDLILLDINMPIMNGFEFIEQYELLHEDWKSKVLVVMLTTSLHADDVERAKKHPSIAEYFYKPLMEQKLGELMEKYF